MEIGEIQELLKEAAEEYEVDISELVTYHLSIDCDNYFESTSYIIDEIDRDIKIDIENKVIQIRLRLY